MLHSYKLHIFPSLGRRSITSVTHYHHNDITGGIQHTNQLRKASRGGQDLSNRWRRLENSVRQKAALSNKLEAFAEYDASVPKSSQSSTLVKTSAKPIQLFHGFEVPEEPSPPADDECCMSGCAVCVYDLYEESLEAYKEAVAGLRNSLSALHIPEAEWPAQIRPKESTSPSREGPRKEVILSAFEEMERRLAMQHQKEAEATASG
ncbi:hypothetical protein BDN70DRAFT_876959 [Pholiota conissans]|uniref:Oxidoreductase-like domain-containing protein n=1 Tax=Pholiota conissans TaxID=109636 RepID=A0A9P6CUT4_9AGAR|nr:hypothetical protein BDN70DRAFT_876959 [Pholiota conissans]